MIIICFSRKSAGKSTIAASIASRLTLDGERTAIADGDPQGTIGNWGVYRKDNKEAPEILCTSARIGADLDYAIKELSKRHDHVIVDLQGADSAENRKTLLLADKVIIPFRPTQPDLDNIPHIAKMLEGLKAMKPEIEFHLVINEAPFSNAKVTEVEEARQYFAQYDLAPLSAVIHSRKAYRDSMAKGLGVCELKDKKAIAEFDSVWSEIYKKAIRRAPNGAPLSTHKKRRKV